jgi:hypothetical protein
VRALLAAALLAGCTAAAGPPAPPAEAPTTAAAPLADLAWLAGHWGAEQDGVWTEEHWMAPRGGAMLATNRVASAESLRFFEFLRIEHRPDGVVYVAQPKGGTATEFRRVDGGEGFVAFANPAHDFPQRIEYRRDGDNLAVTISATVDGVRKESSWTWRRLP